METERILLEKPISTKKALLFIPGVSVKALSDRYKVFAQEGVRTGYAVLRYEFWKDGKELGEQSLESIQKTIDELITYLHQQGYTEIGLIGKSLGGLVALTCKNQAVKVNVLWAPAVAVSPKETFESYKKVLLKSIKKVTDITLSEETLKKIRTPTFIIHGTGDQDIALEYSKKVKEHLKKSELFTLEGADHSFTGKEDILVSKTVEWLRLNF